MSETTPETPQNAPEGPEQVEPKAESTPATKAPQEGAEGQQEDARASDADQLPEWARNERKNLRDEAASWRRKYRDMEDELKKAVTPEDHKRVVDEYMAKIAEYERALTSRDVCEKYNVPADLREFVTGETAEEMEAKAKKLGASIAPAPDPAANSEPSGGLSPTNPLDFEGDPAALAKHMRENRRY